MSESAPTTDRTAIWAVVTLTGLALAAVTVLAAMGRPLDVVVTLVLALVGPTVTSMFTLLRVESMKKDVTQVKDQTNGHMTALLGKIPQGEAPLTRAIDALGAAATPPAPQQPAKE